MLSWDMTDFIDFRTLERPKSPNTYLLASADMCDGATADQPSPVYAATPDHVYQACESVIHARKDWDLVASDPIAHKLRFVSTSGLMRFKDDIDILVVPDGETGAKLAVYSRSRVGYSDLGANAKRVGALLGALGQAGLSS